VRGKLAEMTLACHSEILTIKTCDTWGCGSEVEQVGEALGSIPNTTENKERRLKKRHDFQDLIAVQGKAGVNLIKIHYMHVWKYDIETPLCN
jgi:hypothetical protein